MSEVKEHLQGKLLDDCGNFESLSDSFKVICLIGVTGQGKSSLANSICGEQNKFSTSPGFESLTSRVKGVATNF